MPSSYAPRSGPCERARSASPRQPAEIAPLTPHDHVVATAGHVDHGKSTLVQALTGIDPDRFAEEKRRGLTIDLGFAFTTVRDDVVGFVDVHGHIRFIKNMLAGVGAGEAAMLVVAAKEGRMPPTYAHAHISARHAATHVHVVPAYGDEGAEAMPGPDCRTPFRGGVHTVRAIRGSSSTCEVGMAESRRSFVSVEVTLSTWLC